MKPDDVTSSTYIDLGMENNDKDHKWKVAVHVRISKHKKALQEVITQIFQVKFLLLKKLKNIVERT